MKRLYAKKQSGGTFTLVGGVDTQAQDLTIKDVYLPIQTPQRQSLSPYGSDAKGKSSEMKGHSNTINKWQSDMMTITNSLNSMQDWELATDKGKKLMSMYAQLTSPAYINAVERELKNTEAAEKRIEAEDRATDVFYTTDGNVAVKDSTGKIQLINPTKVDFSKHHVLTAGEVIKELDVNSNLSPIGAKEPFQQSASAFIGTSDISKMLKQSLESIGISASDVKTMIDQIIPPGSPIDIGGLTQKFTEGYVGGVGQRAFKKSNWNVLRSRLENIVTRLNPQQNLFIETMGKLELKRQNLSVTTDNLQAYKNAYITKYIMGALDTSSIKETTLNINEAATKAGFGAGAEEPKERVSYATIALNSLNDTFNIALKGNRVMSFYGSSVSTAQPTETKDGVPVYHTAMTQPLVATTANTANSKIFLGDVEISRNDLSDVMLLQNAAYVLLPTRNGTPAMDIISKYNTQIENIKVKYAKNPNDANAEKELQELLKQKNENTQGIEMKMQLVVPSAVVFNNKAENINSQYFTPNSFRESDNPALYKSMGIRNIDRNDYFSNTKLEAPLIITNVPLNELNRISSSYENVPIKTEGVSNFIIGQTATPSIPATTTPSFSTFSDLN